MMNIARFSGVKFQQPKIIPKNFKSPWEHFVKATGSAEATCKLCIKPTLIQCKGFNTSGLLKHLKGVHRMVHMNRGDCNAEAEAETVAVDHDDEDEEPGASSQSVKKRKLQSKVDSFLKIVPKDNKTPIQSIVGELVSKDGLTFRQIGSSHWIQSMMKRCGYEPPTSHPTVKKYAMDEAALVRSRIAQILIGLKEQGKKFTTSVDEQTTAANFRILNVHVYSESGSFNLGMVRINARCDASTMVKVSCLEVYFA